MCATLMGLAAFAAGGIVLMGWWLGIDALKSIVPGLVTMKVNTALSFILLGSGLALRAREDRWAIVPLVASVGLAAIVGSQYLLGRDLGVDQLLFRELPGQIGTVQLNRMAPTTVVCFITIGAGLTLQAWRRFDWLTTGLLLTGLVIAFVSVLDAIYDPASPTILPGATQMAVVTGIAFIVASVGGLTLMTVHGAFAGYAGGSSSAKLARRLLAASVIVPTVVMGLWLKGEDRGFYDAHYGASIVVIGIVAFLAAVIHQAAEATQRSEVSRARLLEERDRFFDVSLDMLATANADGRFIRLNPAWTTALGYDLGELTSRPFVDFVHPDDREATNIEAARQVELGQSALNFRNRYRHRDGTYRWLEWTSTPSADGTRLYAMARDVTERTLEEQRLVVLAAPAREAEVRRVEAKARIADIIKRRAFKPVYQPVVELASRLIVGFEALTRFDDGSRPNEVFAAALDCGLGIELEAVTLTGAIEGAVVLPRSAWLSLNVSPAMVSRETRLEVVLSGRTRSIVLEITEHEAITEYEPLRDAVRRLGPGVRLAVDDAGAGVANFNHLAELRPAFLKIDIGLVRGVAQDAGRQAVVAGLVHFALSSGCAVIAEGIETEAELARVAELGVTLGQGYLLARPAPAAEWDHFLVKPAAAVLPLHGPRHTKVPSSRAG